MIHLGEMRDLVRHHVVENGLGGEDQPPGKIQVAVARATAPARALIAHGDASAPPAEPLRLVARPMDDLAPRLIAVPASDSPGYRILAARHEQFAADAKRGNPWLVDASDAKRSALERNLRAIDERDTRQHEVEPALDPRRLLFGELQRLAQCDPARQHQFDRTIDLADLKENSLGPRAAPDDEIDVRAAGQRQFAKVRFLEDGHDRAYSAASRRSSWST